MTLTLIQRNTQGSAAPRRAEFRAPGGTLGRGAENHLVLPDEPGRLCRVQAALRIDPYACRLRNLSSMSVVSINDVPLAAGQELAVAPGDTVRIGSYVLGVEVGQEAAAAQAAPPARDDPVDARPFDRPAPLAGSAFPETDPLSATPSSAPAESESAPSPPEDVFSGLFGPGTLPVGTVSDVSAHPFEMDSAQSRNAADPLSHLPRGDASVSRAQRDPLSMFDAPHGGQDVFADSTPTTLPPRDPLAPMRADPVRDTLQRPRDAEGSMPTRDNAHVSGSFLRPAAPRGASAGNDRESTDRNRGERVQDDRGHEDRGHGDRVHGRRNHTDR